MANKAADRTDSTGEGSGIANREEQRRLLAEAMKRKKAREADQYADEILAEVAGKRKQHLVSRHYPNSG
jgi:hypothetical protein